MSGVKEAPLFGSPNNDEVKTVNLKSVEPTSVQQRIANIRDHMITMEGESASPRMERSFSKGSAPLFEKSFNQIYNQWRQDSKK